MNERSKILYDKLVEKGLYTKPYEEFTTQFSTPEKKAKLHSVLQEKGLYTKPYEEFDLQFFPEEKKKDSPNYSPLQGAASGKNILQDIVPSLGESTTPKLPSQLAQKPKATRDETLATDFTVSSVLKAQQKLPEYLQGEQERIVAESTQSIKDELSKLKENYQKKIDANPEKEKELQDEFDKEQNKIIDLRSAAIPMAVESLYKKGKEYKTIDPNDVKELTKAAREIASKPTDFIQKENDLKGLKNSFLSTLGEIPPADKAEIEKELNDIIVQNSILTEQGTPSVFGWKKEVLDKKQKADQRLAELGTAEQTQEEKAEANLLFRASKYYDRILSLPDNEGSFLSGLKSEGRNMLTAGMSDLFDASNIVAISKKQMNGEELTKGEQTLYDAYGVFQTAQNAEQFGKGYERGKGIGGSVAFMGSFALTSGLAGLGEKTALKVLGSQVKNKVVQNIAKGVGSAAVRTPLLVGGMTETAERLAGRPKLDDNGEWKVDPTTVEPVMKAIGKGLYSNFANALGETAGGWLGGTKVSNIVSKTLGLNKIPKNVAKIFNTIGMQPLGELPEEYLTTLMETPVMGDQSLKEAFSGEAMWETAVQVGIMSGFFSSVALPSVASQNAKRSQNANLIKIFGKDRIQTLRTAVENNDKEAFTSALKETLESGAMEEAGMDLETVKRQITRYAFELGQSKGFKVSQEVAKDEAEQTTPATTEETNAAPAEVKETFTIPQVKADPIVFEGKEQLFDFLDKGGESRMPGVDDVGYLDNNVYKAMDEWKKARKVQLGSAMVNKVNFTGQMKDEDGTPILDQYNVEVDGREATFSVPVQGDKTDAEYFESVAKKKAEILKPYQNEKTQNILTSREDLLSSQQNLTDESNRQNQGTVTSGGLQQVVDGGTDAQVMDGKQSRYDIGASGSVLGDTSVKDYSLSDQEAVDLQTSIPNSKTDVSFSETNDANLFHSSISESKKGNKFSASVWVYSPEEYASARKFLTPDGKAGLAITPEGDIISVFSHKEGKGRVPQLMINAIKEGGVTLDNYEGLVEYYAQFGFIPVAKVKFDESQAPPDWNKDVYKDYKNGMPDVVAMVYHGGDPNTLSQRVRKFGDPKLMLDSTPYVDTWEEAKKIQREYAQKIQSGQKSGQNGRTTETQPSQSKESVVSPVESEKGIGVDKSRQSVAKDVAINIGDEMGGEKLPSVDNVYSILEDEESRQGGNWTNNEFGDARFESEQQARAYAQEVHDFLVSLGEAKEIPVYRAVSADEVDLDPYGIGESWSFSLDAAKQFARMNLSGRKIKIISGLVPSENVNWEQAVRLYHNFSDITDGDSEFELPIPANRKILDVRVDDVKNAKERESGNEGINKELSEGIKPSKEHGQNVHADVQSQIDEVKAKIADDFDALMSSIGGKTDLTGAERENALKILARLIGNLAELTSLKGQQLYDELKKQLKEKGITLPADVIDEAVQKHASETSTTETDTEVPQEEDNAPQDSKTRENKQKRTGFEYRKETGKEKGSIETRRDADEVGKVVAEIVDKNPHFYREQHREEIIAEAQAFINENGVDEAYVQLVKKTKDIDELPMRHVARQILMQYYAGDLVQARKEGNDRQANKVADRIVELEDWTQKEARISARTLAFTMWNLMPPDASVFMVSRLISDINRKKTGFEADDAKEFVDEFNKELPEMVKTLLTENADFKNEVDKLQAKIKFLESQKGKDGGSRRVTKTKAKEIAQKIRSMKTDNWGLTFADPIGATVILNGSLEIAAKTVEATGNVLQGIQNALNYIKGTDWYKGLSSNQKSEVEKAVGKKVRDAYDFDAGEYVENTSWYRKETKAPETEEQKQARVEKNEARKAKRDADEKFRDQIYDIVASHFLVDQGKPEDLSKKLEKEMGLTPTEAKKIADIAITSFEVGAKKIFEKTLGLKIPNPKKRQSAFEKFFGLIKRGVLNDDNFYQVFADKYKLKPELTPDEKRKLTELGMNAQKLAPMGLFGELAMNEFLQYVSKVSEVDSWLKRQTKLMRFFNYARMLAGFTTHAVNLKSSAANIALRPVMTAINVGRWLDYAWYKTKGAMGNKSAALKAKEINPIWEYYYMPYTYKAGIKIGTQELINIIKHGDVKRASKYMEQVGNERGDVVPEGEKNTYGKGKSFKPIFISPKFKLFGKQRQVDANFMNNAKYTGRALLAEDQFMFNLPFAHEMSQAARKMMLREGSKLSAKEMRDKIIAEINGSHLTDTQSKQVDEQLLMEIKALQEAGIEVDNGQIASRRYEITRSLLDLDPELIEEVTQLARGDNFTDRRAGVFSVTADALSRIFNKNDVIKLISMTKLPFTVTLGRIGDFTLDTLPGYGALRARGWSPTGIIARSRLAFLSGDATDFWKSPESQGYFRSAQMGEVGSARYYQQMNRQYMGIVTMAIAAHFMLNKWDDDDEDEPWADITGSLPFHNLDEKNRHPDGAYVLRMGKWKMKYNNYPIIAMPLTIIGNYKDHLRAGVNDENLDAKMALSFHAWLHSMSMLSDTSLAKGLGDLLQLLQDGLAIFKGKTQREKLKATETGLEDEELLGNAFEASMKELGKSFGELPLRYLLPTKNNMVQQIWKLADQESRYRGTTAPDLLRYNLGLQNIGNDKRTDIFGETIKMKPGDQGIAWPREDNERWNKIFKYNIYLTDITEKDTKVISGVARTFEWEEFLMRKEMANKEFAQRFDNYFTGLTSDEIKAKYDSYEESGSGASKTRQNKLDKELNDIWKQTKDDVDRYLFTWEKQRLEDPELFKEMFDRGILPPFWNEKIKIGEDRFIVPYDMLMKANEDAMTKYLAKVKMMNLESMNKLDEKADDWWKSALSKPRRDVEKEIEKLYGGKTKK